MKVKEIVSFLESYAPLSFQENYDNSGLLTGSPSMEVNGILLCLDTLEITIEEAIRKNCNLIISHHPLIFGGLKSLTGKNYVERTIIKAIQNNISIYAGHTNFDNIFNGVNKKIAEKIGLDQVKIIVPTKKNLYKLVTFVPKDHAQQVRTAIFNAGAGHIGEYDQCSFNVPGQGTFRGSDNTNPYVGEKGIIHFEDEIRLETIFPSYLRSAVIQALIDSHPYEEVAYDIYQLENEYNKAGSGMIGILNKEMTGTGFLNHLKNIFQTGVIKHTNLLEKKIKKVAVCGGSGSFLVKNAINAGADIFVSADFKYHQFFDAENKIVIADIGHFESEKFTIDVFYEILVKKFPNFAVQKSEIISNPINYF